MDKGKINVQTENIFPIIKKFLYTDQEIFLREIVSNAVDATQKLKTLAGLGKFTGELGDLSINITIDKKKKTLTISDKGIGMTHDEVIKYITEIAFSGAEDFVAKFKNKSESEVNAIIGHFGMGFYSAFMVADKVEIETKTYKQGGQSKAVHWECDGNIDYSISEGNKKDRGTDIILHISKDSEEYLEEHAILSLLKKYCRFLPVPIIFGTETVYEPIEGETDENGKEKTKEVQQPRIINNTNPLWKQKPSDLTEEDYNKFYHELYPMTYDDPLFYVHLNVDYPFNLTGILYFPKIKRNVEIQKEKIQLYSNQVFVTDNVEGIVPDFLTLLHGVLDSPDIPLNVSRSALQSDSNVKKISNHILKKVSDKLEELFKNNREDFEKKWDDIKVFIEYGIISEEKFYDKAKNFTLLKNTKNQYFTIEEYKKEIKVNQTDKDNKIIAIYTSNIEEQYSFIEATKDAGYDVLILNEVIDGYFINAIESKNTDLAFVRVDSDIPSKLINKDEETPSKLNEEEKTKVKDLFEGIVDKAQFTVEMESMSETDMPVIITRTEFMRRMKDMSKLGGGGFYGMDFPESFNLKVNENHPLITKLVESDNENEKKQVAEQLIDLAMLQQDILKGEKLANFLKRSINLI
ncbi:molecular chaperone HtpG [Bacteroidales bacterium OttesenSCG-928-K22]|nr:molecular chaperone HtpG [Bacteroidales bacterium OttesenSCG-928-K22]